MVHKGEIGGGGEEKIAKGVRNEGWGGGSLNAVRFGGKRLCGHFPIE